MPEVLYPKYKNSLSFTNKTCRFIWGIVYVFFYRPFSLPVFHTWRNSVLRLFGAKIGAGSVIHASVKIWAPWNLEIGQRTAIGPQVECYNPARIKIGNKVTISQKSYLCTATHDYTTLEKPLITKNITIDDYAWVCADVFIAPGITIGQGAVVGSRAAVFKDIEPWTVVGGNPAKFIKKREIKAE
jgi:putative colanic acid biosynthesis acetyltransferase WcaF